ncbi:porin family protein, partial [Marinilabilia sp.]
AEFSGFDDGNSEKTMNVITKPAMRTGKFGKVYVGFGSDGYYQGGGMVNDFDGDRRISVIASLNNVNKQNFSREDLLGTMGSSRGRSGDGGGGGKRLRGPLDQSINMGNNSGVNETSSFGINYQNKIGEKLTINGSYFFNMIENENEEEIWRNFFSGQDSLKFYSEESESGFENLNNRLNMRLNYEFDPKNSLIFLPRFSFQNNESYDAGFSKTFNGDELIKSQETNLVSRNDGYDLAATLIYRHKFNRKGRTISMMVNSNISDSEGEEEQVTSDLLTEISDEIVIYDQNKLTDKTTKNIRGRLVFTESLSVNGQLMLSLGVSSSDKENEKWVFENDSFGESLAPSLSNVFNSKFESYSSEVGYRYAKEKIDFVFSLAGEKTVLSSFADYPDSYELKKDFTSLRPRIRFNWTPVTGKNLVVLYHALTKEPSADQLQDVVDTSDPLFVSAGNPDLSQQSIHRGVARYTDVNTKNGRSLALVLIAEKGFDYIVNHTYTDPGMIPERYLFPDGGQLTLTENMEGYLDLKGIVSLGIPVPWIDSNLSTNTTFSYNQLPGKVNNEAIETKTLAYNQGVTLASNISEDVDFTIFWNGGWDKIQSTYESQEESYYTQTSGFKLNWVFGDDWVFNSTLNHLWYVGLSESIDPNYTLLNASIGKKIFKDRSGEIKLGVYDVLNENQSTSRNLTETYEEQSRSLVIQRYAMVTFSWSFRDFISGAMQEAPRRRENRSFPARSF